MKADGMDPVLIAKYTGLPESEVLQLYFLSGIKNTESVLFIADSPPQVLFGNQIVFGNKLFAAYDIASLQYLLYPQQHQ